MKLHFWEISGNNYIMLDRVYLSHIQNLFLSKYKTFGSLSNAIGFSESVCRRVFSGLYRVKCVFIRKICKLFTIDLNLIEKKIIWIGNPNSGGIRKPKLPFNFNSRHGSRFLAAIYNDGYLTAYGAYYCNMDRGLRESIKADAIEVFGDCSLSIKEHIKIEDQFLRFPAIIRNVLSSLPNLRGKKTLNNPSIPEFVKSTPETMCGWIEQTIADEGHVRYFPHKYRRSITWRRCIDVTHLIPPQFTFDQKISNKKIPRSLKSRILRVDFRFIKDEIEILNSLGIYHRVYLHEIYKTKDGRIKAKFEIGITKRQNLIKLRELIKIPHNRKNNLFTKMLSGFKRYKEPIRIRDNIVSICKKRGYVTSKYLGKIMGYKNFNNSNKWLKFFEKEGLLTKIKDSIKISGEPARYTLTQDK